MPAVTALHAVANGNLRVTLADGSTRTLRRDTLQVIAGTPLTADQWWETYRILVAKGGSLPRPVSYQEQAP
jgi:hypothetical protein